MTPNRRPALLDAWREITQRTRGRAFLISTVVIVALVVGGVVIPGLADQTTRVQAGLTGATPAALPSALRDAARAGEVKLELRRCPTVAAGEKAVLDEDVDVLIVAVNRLVWKSEPNADAGAIVTSAVQRLRFAERAAAVGLTPTQATTLLAPARVPARSLEPVDADQAAREAIAFVSFILLLMMLIISGNAVAEGVAQEKGSRVMELLVCRVRPRDLLAGKVLGIGVPGLGQMLLALIAGGVAIVALDSIDVPAAVPATLASAVGSWHGSRSSASSTRAARPADAPPRRPSRELGDAARLVGRGGADRLRRPVHRVQRPRLQHDVNLAVDFVVVLGGFVAYAAATGLDIRATFTRSSRCRCC
jgi:ABC-2 type transport system permease protein